MKTDKEKILELIQERKNKSIKRMVSQRYNDTDRYKKKDGTKELMWDAAYAELLAGELLAKDEKSVKCWVPTQCMSDKKIAKKLNISGLDLVEFPYPKEVFQYIGIDVKYQSTAHMYGTVNIEWETWYNGKWDKNRGSTIHTRKANWYLYVLKDKAYLIHKLKLLDLVDKLNLQPVESRYTDKRLTQIRFPIYSLDKESARVYDIPEEDRKNFEQYKLQ